MVYKLDGTQANSGTAPADADLIPFFDASASGTDPTDKIADCTGAQLAAYVATKLGLGGVNNMDATDDPDANDDTGSGYEVGSLWYNQTNDKLWVAESVGAAAASWTNVSATVTEKVLEDLWQAAATPILATGDKFPFADVSGTDTIGTATAPDICSTGGALLASAPLLAGDLDLNSNDIIGTGDILTTGSMDLTHTAAEDDDHAQEIICDAAGFGDVKAVDIDYITGAINTGASEAAILVNIDETAATGGDVIGMEVLATAGAADRLIGALSGAGIDPIVQLSGAFADADTVDDNGTDETVALSTGGGGAVAIFTNDNEYVIVGSATKFEEIEFDLGTVASGAGVAPTFEFSIGIGTWTAFTPTDGTNGFKNTGVIAWLDADIPTWATGAGTEYLVRITRTRNTVATTPVADLVQIVAATEYSWDKDGDIAVNGISATAGILLTEAADHTNTPAATKGELWVRNDTPNVLVYTDDAGTDTVLGSVTEKAIEDVIEALTPAAPAALDEIPYRDISGTDNLGAATPQQIVETAHTAMGVRPLIHTTSAGDPLVTWDTDDTTGDLKAHGQGDTHYNTSTLVLWVCKNPVATAAQWFDASTGGAGDAWGDVVDADIIPDADGTRDLGADATRFALGYVDDLHVTAGMLLTEAADHSNTPAAGKGEYWVKNDAPCTPNFTDDAGNDIVLGNGPGSTYTFSVPVFTDSSTSTYTNSLQCGIPETGDVQSILFHVYKTIGADATNYWTWMPKIGDTGGDRDLLASAYSHASTAVDIDDAAVDMGTIHGTPGVVAGESIKLTATANGTPPNYFNAGGFMIITVKRT
jgi:hypothetical protein